MAIRVLMISGISAVFIVNIPATREFTALIILLLIASMLGALFLLPAIYAALIGRRESLDDIDYPGRPDTEAIEAQPAAASSRAEGSGLSRFTVQE